MDPTTPDMAHKMLSFLELGGKLNFYILVPIATALYAFLAGYFKNYQRPAEALIRDLDIVTHSIRRARAEWGETRETLDNRIDQIFELSPFRGAWSEYRQSLRRLSAPEGGGAPMVLATVPSQTFFSKDSLVDLNINADFYRHLPGMLTGIGILGTFSGLVWGLLQFRPDFGRAAASLPALIEEVTSAFIGSGLAILAAIFVTAREKSLLSRCYRRVDALTREIDSLYALGAGEEYLARLITTVESAAERQIAAHAGQSRALSAEIAAAVGQALTGPMHQVSSAVARATANQNDAVVGLLDTLVNGFMQRFGDTVGGQMAAIGQSITLSSTALSSVQESLERSADDMSRAGAEAAAALAARLSEAQDAMAATLLQQQKQSALALDSAIDSVLIKMQGAMQRLAEERAAQTAQDQERQDNLLAAAKELYAGLAAPVDNLVREIRGSLIESRESAEAAQDAALDAILGMREGASVMKTAAERFAATGASMTQVTESMQATMEDLRATAEAVRGTLREYEKIQSLIQDHVSELQEMVESARRESGVSGTLVADMERLVAGFAEAERHSAAYMERLNDILRQSFRDFGLEMVGQVRTITDESNRQFSASLQALSGTVESMVSSVTKLRRAG